MSLSTKPKRLTTTINHSTNTTNIQTTTTINQNTQMITMFAPTLHPFHHIAAIDDLMLQARLHHMHKRRQTVTLEPSYSYRCEQEGGVLEIELPGVLKEDITVEVQGRNLKVTGKRYRYGKLESHAKRVKVMANGDEGSAESGDSPKVNDTADNDVSKLDSQPGNAVEGGVQETTENDENVTVGNEKECSAGKVDCHSGVTVYRSVFRLNDMLNAEGVEVEGYSDGVLRMRLRRKERAAPRKIAIQ